MRVVDRAYRVIRLVCEMGAVYCTNSSHADKASFDS